ncbi:MAG: hypothetical protein Q7S66_00800 [bacterium]|nr:hypothetical protein [bacterium]
MKKIKKHLITRFTVILFFYFLLLPSANVSASIVGENCFQPGTVGSEMFACTIGSCQQSTHSVSFCTCTELDGRGGDVAMSKGASKSCSDSYGGDPGGGKIWKCIQGYSETSNLNYCVTSGGETAKFSGPETYFNQTIATERAKSAFLAAEQAGTAVITVTNLIQDINDKINIKIPGLNFTKLSSQLDPEGNLLIPWIAEYISAIYNYAMIVGSIIAVVIIIVNGARVIISAGGEQKGTAIKHIGQVVVGLVILWGSYAIMYTLNPNLVSFKALKIQYIQPTEIQTEGSPDTTAAAQQNLKVIAAPDFSKCQLDKYKTFGQGNNMFGTANGQCLKWVKQSWANACGGDIPAALSDVGAWDVAITFQTNNKFHPCNLEGIRNGDLVFMASRGSNYIGLWENFRPGPDGCTVADTAKKPLYFNARGGDITQYERALNPVQGMPPVTHIGVYYDGVVYHQIGFISSDPISPQTNLTQQTSKKQLWQDVQAKLNGNFIHNSGEFIAGYGSWQ